MRTAVTLILLCLPVLASAEPGIPALSVDTGPEGQTYTLTIQILAVMTAVTLLPAILLSMTAFTRIIIVLAILRQALGTPQTPPNQVMVGLAMFLTFFVMAPIIDTAYTEGAQPYLEGTLPIDQALSAGLEPIKTFMLDQTRESDLMMFAEISGVDGFESPADVPVSVLIPSFVTSELKTAFQIGFLVFIPFLIIDLVVSSVLMSMGMMMLSPMLISLPFKIMLFVLIDGWALLLGTLAASFYT